MSNFKAVNSQLMPSISGEWKKKDFRDWSVVEVATLENEDLCDAPSSIFAEHFLAKAAHFLRRVLVARVIAYVDVNHLHLRVNVAAHDRNEVEFRVFRLEVLPHLKSS